MGSLPAGAKCRFNHGVSVYTVAFSPDGGLLASAGNNNKVIIWDIMSRKERGTIRGHTKSVKSVVFSPDGQKLASASHDGYVRLWDVSSRNRLHAFLHGGWVRSVAFSPDGNTLVSGGGDKKGSITLWDIQENRRKTDFPGHVGNVESVMFSPNGQLLASSSRDRTVKLWDVSNQQLRKNLTKHKNVVHAVAFSPDSKTIATSSDDYTIKLWNTSSGENVADFKIAGGMNVRALALKFSPNGKYLALACSDNTVRLFSVVERKEATKFRGHNGAVYSIAFSPDGKTLASGGQDRTVLLWNISHFNIIPPDPIHNSKPEPIAVDTIPPTIEINSPIGRVVPPEIEQLLIRGEVDDDNGINVVKVNDQEVRVSAEGKFTSSVTLTGGENEIRVTATDIYDNIGTKRFTVERPGPIDTEPPVITFDNTLKSRHHSQNARFTVKGSVDDNNGVDELKVNDELVTISVEGEFTTHVQLKKGKNVIRVTATDVQGNMDTDSLTINIPNLGPKIRILEPEFGISRGLKPIININDASTEIVGEVKDEDGVSEVRVNGRKVLVREKVFRTEVSLNYGDNSIHITATDGLGALSENRILIRRPQSYRTGKDYALLFAVENYDHWPNLRYPVSDAEKIQRDLKYIYGFQTELVNNPTKEEIFNKVREYAEKLYDDDDQLFVFFAGHGHFDDTFKEGYLVARDTNLPANDNGLLSYVSHSRIRDIIDRMNCKHIFLVMDTCYSGTFDRRIAMRGSDEDIYKQQLTEGDVKRILEYTTRWYLTSGQKEQVPDVSKFVNVFLDALRKKGGQDKILTIEEILSFMEHLDKPKPHASGFGSDEPGSDFLFFAK